MRYLVIPAYEPDQKLLNLLQEVKQIPSLTTIVVDDGSDAAYQPIFERALSSSIVLSHPHNLGKGRALKTAFTYLLEHKQTLGEGVVITADSDGQHTVSDILKVCHACETSNNALITGERAFTGKVPLRSRFGNTITKYVFTLSTGLSLTDTQCGLRAFPTSLLPFFCQIKGDRYEYEMNVLLEGAKTIPIKGVPIETVYLDGNQSSHFHPIKDAVKIYKEILKFTMSSLLSFSVDYIGYMIFLLLFSFAPMELRLVLSNVLSRLCSATFNFTINKKFVFHDTQSSIKTGGKYALLASFLLLFNTLLLLCVTQLGIHNVYLAKIIVELLLFILSWIIQRHCIFQKQYEVK